MPTREHVHGASKITCTCMFDIISSYLLSYYGNVVSEPIFIKDFRLSKYINYVPCILATLTLIITISCNSPPGIIETGIVTLDEGTTVIIKGIL